MSDGQVGGPIGVVISGAGARGAYEAGVLAALIPQVFTSGNLDDAIFVGTSAGAVNAALWSFYADGTRTLQQVGDAVCDFWVELEQPKVFRFKPVFQRWFGAPVALLDTSPLSTTVRNKLGISTSVPIGQGKIGTVALVATRCAESASGCRSRVFYSGKAGKPVASPGTAIDYVPASLTLEHVFASSAIPVAFPPVDVTSPPGSTGYYMDGGVRLNTPIEPALKLGAKRIVVVSSHSTTYPTQPLGVIAAPSLSAVIAQILHVVLADGMVEDLLRLRSLNQIALNAPNNSLKNTAGRTYEVIEWMAASPLSGQLAQMVELAFADKKRLCKEGLLQGSQALGCAIGLLGKGAGVNELLSYLLFEPNYAQRQIDQGRVDGAKAVREGWKT